MRQYGDPWLGASGPGDEVFIYINRPRCEKVPRRKDTRVSGSDIFELFLDRKQAGIPPLYMPRVSGVMLAGEDMLLAAGTAPGAPEPDGWIPAVPTIPEGE